MACVEFGRVANIAEIALKIEEAVETVKQNEEECREMQMIVARVCAIFKHLDNLTELMKDETMCHALEDLAVALECSLQLVKECQRRKHIFCRCLVDRKMAKEFERVRRDIKSKVQVATFVSTVHTTITISSAITALPPRPPPPPRVIADGEESLMDAEVADPLHGYHQTHENRSEINGEENCVLPVGSNTSIASFSGTGFYEFSLSDLKVATNNFSEENKIGSSPLATVYEGILCGRHEVAIKYHTRQEEFSEKRAVDGLKHVSTKIQHPNILGVHGYSLNEYSSVNDKINEEDHCYSFLVVEEKMSGGSLQQHITGPQRYEWDKIFQIIKATADGLLWIHVNGAVHSNLKPSNILFDRDHNPKICDFSVSRVLDHGDQRHRYSAPEFQAYENTLTTMSDVYAFGLILLETIWSMCKRKPVDDNPKATIKWARELRHRQRMNLFGKRPQRIQELLKATVLDKSKLKQVKQCMELGLRCTEEKPDNRPNMANVTVMLKNIQNGKNIDDEDAIINN